MPWILLCSYYKKYRLLCRRINLFIISVIFFYKCIKSTLVNFIFQLFTSSIHLLNTPLLYFNKFRSTIPHFRGWNGGYGIANSLSFFIAAYIFSSLFCFLPEVFSLPQKCDLLLYLPKYSGVLRFPVLSSLLPQA